jgi:hypothetical protein
MSSSSDNGTWNMTGFSANIIIDIPEYDKQKEVLKKYEKSERFEDETINCSIFLPGNRSHPPLLLHAALSQLLRIVM